ncbi:rhythmically expressed gene 5 protein [Harmonia axyridis]|uniref:rhythmically expressed gene 5 protein n=1 Tax=Harmonia axyridis TaxID=115357 RepID=UPI001E276605|nr:rhythmically expressed gene 5 protein [Harmonia axyridis]
MENLAKVLCLCAFVGQLSGSAIPMWEYLSKQEKMSYLYSMFANQVEEFCESSNMKNCNHELLKYGLDKLKDMSEDHLDTMDPYQRGASNIIWDAMMEGHQMASTTPKPQNLVTTTAKPNSYDDHSFDEEFGNQGAGSARIDTIYRVPPPKGFIFKAETGKPLYTYPHNYQYISRINKGNIANQYTTTTLKTPSIYVDAPLSGPMEVRVYPDGTPVRDSLKQLPHDEDLRQYQLSKVKIPNL